MTITPKIKTQSIFEIPTPEITAILFIIQITIILPTKKIAGQIFSFLILYPLFSVIGGIMKIKAVRIRPAIIAATGFEILSLPKTTLFLKIAEAKRRITVLLTQKLKKFTSFF